jgi:serine/threonine-protein kinase
VCAAIVADPPIPVRVLRPDVSPALEAVITRCLQKDPQQRYQSISDLMRDLSPLIGRAGPSTSEAIPAPYYSSHPRIVVSTPQFGSERPPHHDSPTVAIPSGTPSVGSTLESARLHTGLGAAGLSDSRVQVLSRPLSQRPPSRVGLWLGLAGAVAVLGAGALIVLLRSNGAATAPSAAPVVSAPAPAAATEPFTLSIDSEPTAATVTEADVVLGTTPLKIALKPGGPERVFRVEKSGYQPYVIKQEPARADVRVQAALVPRPREAAAAPSAAAAPVKAVAPVQPKPRPAPAKPPPEKPKSPSDIRLER